MLSSEPYRLEKHSLKAALINGFFYTCARPGRSLGRQKSVVTDEAVHAWIKGINKEMQSGASGDHGIKDEIAIVSVLGRKPHGLSEFSYYSFRGGFDLVEERPNCLTWQEWLTKHYGYQYRVYEFPTEDLKPINEDIKKRVIRAILDLVDSGTRVVLVDSGGVGRTGSIVHAVPSSM
jgi:hypothetical protein